MPINPVVFRLAGIEIRAFAGAILLAAALGLAVIGWTARQNRQLPLRWLDAAIGALIGALIGGRLGHVLLEWAYFSAHTDQIASLIGGGLDWHGAVLGGLIGAALIARLRGVPFGAFADACAIAVPLGALAIWAGCGAAACAYGAEVGTLADFPAWLVIEAPDVFGQIAPRLNLPQIGVAFSVAAYVFIILLSATGRARGVRLWIALAALGLGMALIDAFRGDYVITIWDRRADQVLDLAVLLCAVLLIAVPRLLVHRRR